MARNGRNGTVPRQGADALTGYRGPGVLRSPVLPGSVSSVPIPAIPTTAVPGKGDLGLLGQQFGRTGLLQFGGYLYEEPLQELQGAKWTAAVREMVENDDTIGGILFAIEMLAREVDFSVQPATDDGSGGAAPAEAEEVAGFVRQCLFDDMSQTWQETLAEILTMLPWGYSCLETVYKRRAGPRDDPDETSRFNDGKVGWAGWYIRAQETVLKWEFDQLGHILGLTQIAPPDYALRTVPLTKALLFRTKTHKNNPTGKSILRNAYTDWQAKVNLRKIEGIGAERDLCGIPVIYAPPEIFDAGATSAQQAIFTSLQKIVTNLRQDEQAGVLMPNVYDDGGHRLYELQLLSSPGAKTIDVNPIIQRYDQRIAMSVMADFMLLGAEKTGSYALATTKSKLFAVALGAFLDTICQTINRFAIPRLVALNGYPPESAPRLQHGDVEAIDLGDLGAYVTALAGAGVLFTDDEQGYLKRAANLPVATEEVG